MLDTVNLKTITQQDLATLGLGEVAYVRSVTVEGEHVFAIMAANGQQVGLAPSYDSAVAAIQQHDLGHAGVH